MTLLVAVALTVAGILWRPRRKVERVRGVPRPASIFLVALVCLSVRPLLATPLRARARRDMTCDMNRCYLETDPPSKAPTDASSAL